MIVLIATTLGGGDSDGPGDRPGQAGQEKPHHDGSGNVPKIYVVQNGDTLTSIAHETGVPVATIVKLNPGVDPQILNSGEKLKLR